MVDFDPVAEVDVVGGSSYHLSDIDVLVEGEDVGVAWTGFAHSSSDVVYSVALGLTPAAADVVSVTFLGSDIYSYVFRHPRLIDGATYYATVIADTAFSSANSSSNGVQVFRVSQSALQQATVYDGSSQLMDAKYIASASQVSSQWFFPAHIHARISHYMWGVFREVGDPFSSASGSGSGSQEENQLQVVRDYQNVAKATSAIAAVADVKSDGTVFVNAVKACFATHCLAPVFSSGFQISIPPRPGSINAVYTPFEMDEIYGLSLSGRLEVRWEEFSDPQLAYYEWSLGTGVQGSELLVGWNEVANHFSVILNVTLSLHYSNVVTVRGFNSAGLYASTKTTLHWNVGGAVISQSSVPRSPLLVYDIPGSEVRSDPSLTGWRELSYEVLEVQDVDYIDSRTSLSGIWPNLRYTQYNYSISSQPAFQPCSSQYSLACGTTFHNSVTAVVSLPLSEGQKYYFCVQGLREHAIHETAATPPLLETCSNGVVVDVSPPRGGCVKIISPVLNEFGHVTGSGDNVGGRLRVDAARDCNAFNDTMFQPSTTDLYLIWDEFVDVEEYGNAFHVSSVASYSYAIGK